ncbi:MAG: hypothetical protein ACREPV_11205 [Lysobacter sp.]
MDKPLPDHLRWQLRELRREQAPARDLWPDIAARLTTQAPGTHASTQHVAPRRWALPVALAATLALAIGVVGWQQGLVRAPSTTPATIATGPYDTAPSLVQREAAGMTRQYQAALGEIDGASSSPAPALQPAFDELDRSARLILAALERDPDSRLLLQQLRRTYSHRLALAQRIAIS